MLNELYEFLGRLVVFAIRTRYRTQIRVAAAAGIAAILAGGYLIAHRAPPEG